MGWMGNLSAALSARISLSLSLSEDGITNKQTNNDCFSRVAAGVPSAPHRNSVQIHSFIHSFTGKGETVGIDMSVRADEGETKRVPLPPPPPNRRFFPES
jgi:hypothetical protein